MRHGKCREKSADGVTGQSYFRRSAGAKPSRAARNHDGAFSEVQRARGAGSVRADMLRSRNLTVKAGGDGPVLLQAANTRFARGGMHAVIGPSGCGKTTLMKATLGLIPAEGAAHLDGVPVAFGSDIAGRVGFVPQFTCAHEALTVEEALRFQLELAVKEEDLRSRRLEHTLGVTGLATHRHKRVGALSGGQLRRLGLALELTLDPPCLVCDEATSGLDPNSEAAILALLRALCRDDGKTVVCIIHNLGALHAFDTVTVLFRGRVVFQGPPGDIAQKFGVASPTELYAALEANPPPEDPEPVANAPTEAGIVPTAADAGDRPGFGAQLVTLLRRRTLLLLRDHGQLGLILAIAFGFPLLVAVFALKGIPETPTVPLDRAAASITAMETALRIQVDRANTASLAAGLVMFQTILLTLMGANNGGREIAAERRLLEKEKLTGLNPAAYASSKLVFTGVLALAQGAWMTAFVKVICGLPGPWVEQVAALGACALAMTWVCLGLSALMRSAEKASLISIYLVGFQLPLSGVMLRLPEAMEGVCRPFINAYWAWSGYMKSMEGDRLYDAYRESAPAGLTIAATGVALTVLLAHAAVGAAMTYAGCSRRSE